MADLLINNQDALQTWGVRMGDNFLDALNTPSEMKAYITNESRSEHGRQIITNNAKGESLARVKHRDITLSFTITGNTQSDFQIKKNAFLEELMKGDVTIAVPKDNANVYHLVYSGRGQSYSQNIDRTFCKFTAKFEEPNPTNRD